MRVESQVVVVKTAPLSRPNDEGGYVSRGRWWTNKPLRLAFKQGRSGACREVGGGPWWPKTALHLVFEQQWATKVGVGRRVWWRKTPLASRIHGTRGGGATMPSVGPVILEVSKDKKRSMSMYLVRPHYVNLQG
jgi:hypothetical protein